jgi:prolipoprotein diacylglyceryltransferase
MAAATFLFLLERNLRRRGASLGTRPWIVAIAVLAAGIGGRLHYVIEKVAGGGIGLTDIPAALAPGSSGSTFFGAMGGILLSLLLLRRWVPGGSLARLADDAVGGLGVAILFGRMGCLAQGCCLGEASDLPWALPPGLHGVDGSPRLHPLALYLGLWALVSAWGSAIVAAAVTRNSGKQPGAWRSGGGAGQRALLFLTMFAAGRAWLEIYRMESIETSGAGRWALGESWILAVAGLIVLLARVRRKPLTVGSRLPNLG